MDDIRLIRDPKELSGTLYIEVLPGKYAGRCWNHGSLFVPEEVFGCLEQLIERRETRYDHWAFTEIARETWELLIPDFVALANALENASGIDDIRGQLRFIFRASESRFATNFRGNADRLAALIRELVAWINDQLSRHDMIAILGI